MQEKKPTPPKEPGALYYYRKRTVLIFPGIEKREEKRKRQFVCSRKEREKKTTNSFKGEKSKVRSLFPGKYWIKKANVPNFGRKKGREKRGKKVSPESQKKGGGRIRRSKKKKKGGRGILRIHFGNNQGAICPAWQSWEGAL